MHTATRLAIQLLKKVKKINPLIYICFYGLYAPLNEVYLRHLGVDIILGGEFEESLTSFCYRLNQEKNESLSDDDRVLQIEPVISLKRQQFILPGIHIIGSISQNLWYSATVQNNKLTKLTGGV